MLARAATKAWKMEDVSTSDTDPAVTETWAPARRGHGLRKLIRKAPLDYVIGGAVLGLYLIVQLLLLEGPRPLDSAKYFDTAVDFPNVPIDLWTLRIGLIAPIRIAVLVFGPSEAALYAVPIAAGLLLTAAVYGTMLLLFRDRALAAAAALVTVLNPSYLYYSSHIYPDALAAAAFTAGFFFLVLAAVRAESGARGWIPALAVVCAGVLFGWTYLIREFSPFLLPTVAVAVVLLRYSVRRVVLLAGVALLTAGLQLVYGLVRYGDPFIHAHRLLNRRESGFGRGGGMDRRMERIQSHLDNVVDTMIVFPRLVLTWRTGWLFLLLIVVFVIALALVRDRRFWIFAAWGLSFWAIMTLIGLGELPSGRWILNVTNVRYWYPFFPGLVMGALGGMWLLLQRWLPTLRGVRLAPAVVVAFALVTVGPGLAEFKNCADQRTRWNDTAGRWQELRSWFATPAAEQFDTVWTDVTTQRLVPAYTATTFGRRLWHGEVETFVDAGGHVPVGTDISRSLLLVLKDRFRARVRQPEKRLEELRREWSPVFITNDGYMVLLAHESSTTSHTAQVKGEWWELASGPRRVDPGTCGRNPYTGAADL
jgi:hypothetical protein